MEEMCDIILFFGEELSALTVKRENLRRAQFWKKIRKLTRPEIFCRPFNVRNFFQRPQKLKFLNLWIC